MKSSFELAMERFGGPLKELSEQQKKEIAEIDSRMKAKLAEAEITKNKRLSEALGDIMQTEQILKDYAVEVASINSKFDIKKEKVRES